MHAGDQLTKRCLQQPANVQEIGKIQKQGNKLANLGSVIYIYIYAFLGVLSGGTLILNNPLKTFLFFKYRQSPRHFNHAG